MHMFYVFEDGQLLKKLKIKNQRVEDAQIRTMRFIEKIMSYMDYYFTLGGLFPVSHCSAQYLNITLHM
jgi:hypothetical protein